VGTRCIADVDSYFFGLRTESVAGLKSLWKFNHCPALPIDLTFSLTDHTQSQSQKAALDVCSWVTFVISSQMAVRSVGDELRCQQRPAP
jgi:hypothetical protein